MKDDLISRKAAIKFAKEQMIKETGAYSKGRNAAFLIMKSALNNPDAIPSVAAVPLDKLCEWLAGYAEPPLDALIICDNPFEAWKMALTKWMEEQDATNRR